MVSRHNKSENASIVADGYPKTVHKMKDDIKRT